MDEEKAINESLARPMLASGRMVYGLDSVNNRAVVGVQKTDGSWVSLSFSMEGFEDLVSEMNVAADKMKLAKTG
jgi:hypothetical protein